MAGNLGPDALIGALAAGTSVVEAARLAGISERTAWRRLADADTQQQVRDARAALFASVVGQVTAALTAAVATLVRNLEAEQPAVQVRAAATVLDQVVKLRASEELERRVAALEAVLGAGATKGTR